MMLTWLVLASSISACAVSVEDQQNRIIGSGV